MKKLILSALCAVCGLTSLSAQNALQNEILEVAHRTNNYFMTKYNDPTIDTYVKKVRTYAKSMKNVEEATYQQPLDSCRILRGLDGTL